MNRFYFFFYNLGICLYSSGIRVAALFQPKAALWVKGRKGIFREIEKALEKEKDLRIAWFHCASLGEFEQGRPVMESFREKHPDYRIFVTFFSPSGFEIRKNYKGADFIFYLPSDTRKNAKKFIDLINPRIAFFIKYEYWFNYLHELGKRDIPVYSVSAVFRQGQHFFRWYGKWALRQLKQISWYFVQDEESKKLLNSAGFSNVSVTGDTRFDRVYAVSMESKPFPLVEKFCSGNKIFLAGSSWPADEKVYFPFIRNGPEGWKSIIAPHEIHSERLSSLVHAFSYPALKYSEATENGIAGSKVLIIDSIGMLAHIYRYATVAFVGGAFGSGLHNILEPAVFGIPVIFGPGYDKFNEAKELLRLGGAFSIGSPEELTAVMDRLDNEPEFYRNAGDICRRYVLQNKDVTLRILEQIHA